MTCVSHARNPGKEIPLLSGLPLFDWRAPAPTLASPRINVAARLSLRTGLPLGVVLAHVELAGLGIPEGC